MNHDGAPAPPTSPVPSASTASASSPGRAHRFLVATTIVLAIALAGAIAFILVRPQSPGAGSSAGAAGSAASASSTSGSSAQGGSGGSSENSAASGGSATEAPSVTDPQALAIMHAEVHRDPSDPQAKGSVDAPAVMVLYSDFACPYCTLLARNVEPQLQDLIDNGTLRIEWRDLAQISPTSPLAAQAGIAAGKQGYFWQLHDVMYAAADPNSHPEYTQESLEAFAAQAGVPNLEQFRSDMLAPQTVEAVAAAKKHAHSLGILGTPFMIINDAFVSGYQDAGMIRATIESQARLHQASAPSSSGSGQ